MFECQKQLGCGGCLVIGPVGGAHFICKLDYEEQAAKIRARRAASEAAKQEQQAKP